MIEPHKKTAAVVGLNWGIRSHLPVLRSLGWSVDLLCGRDAARTAETARRCGIPQTTTNLHMALQGGYSLVAAALPWWLHDDLLAQAARSTSRVLLEHPVALTTIRLRELVQSGQATTNRLFVNMPSRYMKGVRSLSSLIVKGELGSPVEVEHSLVYPMNEERDWLPLLLYHSLDVANTLFGHRPGAVVDASAAGTTTVQISEVPSWSWPICMNEQNSEALQFDGVSTTIRFPQGNYNLTIERRPMATFLESVHACGSLRHASYRTELLRHDETSPWHSTALWTGPPGALPIYDWLEEGDCWHAAQLDQAVSIAACMDNEEVLVAPATLTDAAAAQELLVAVTKGLAS